MTAQEGRGTLKIVAELQEGYKKGGIEYANLTAQLDIAVQLTRIADALEKTETVFNP